MIPPGVRLGTMVKAISAVGGAVTADCGEHGWSVAVLHVTGTFAGHNVSFEGSVNGKDWFSIQATKTDSNAVQTATGKMNGDPGHAWRVNASGLSHVRVRCTQHTSGTANWHIRVGS